MSPWTRHVILFFLCVHYLPELYIAHIGVWIGFTTLSIYFSQGFAQHCLLPFSYNFPLLAFFRVFPVLWKIAKIFVDPKTRAKCVVLKNSELHKLCDYFNPEDLPEEFGGTCRCESGCLPPVPKHMVSLTFWKKFHFPSDEHGRWYNLRAFACNLRARHDGTMGDIQEPLWRFGFRHSYFFVQNS